MLTRGLSGLLLRHLQSNLCSSSSGSSHVAGAVSLCSGARWFAAAAAEQPTAASSGVGPRSMLDSSIAHTGVAGEAVGKAAQRTAAASAAAAQADTSPFRKFTGLLMDVVLIGGLGYGVATGGCYLRYGTEEAEEMLNQLKQQEDRSPWEEAQLMWWQQYVDVVQPLAEKIHEYTDPRSPALLPDQPPHYAAMGIKTLVLDLEGLLVHKEWTRAKGWQVYKRPGAADFLQAMAQNYEVVLYTDETNTYADPVLARLDADGRCISWRLYRQDTQYADGAHVRDLSKLNRDLGRVLFLSADPGAYKFQPENTLKLKPWKGDAQDTTLLDLIPFLLMINQAGVSDVRRVVASYDGEEDAVAAFKKRMQEVAAHKKLRLPGGGLFKR